ncbi:MAG: DUF1801 domain-containing protein [Cyclobacteriaceae bacterium]
MAAASVDEYIERCPEEARDLLREVRKRLHTLFPDAQEGMNYGVPTMKIGKRMVHYAAFKNHLGFYPSPQTIEAFADDLKPYSTSRGTIRFPLNKPIPFELIEEISKFTLNELPA